MNRSHLRALTGMRFVAAFQVLIFHCGGWQRWSSGGAPQDIIRNIAGSGYVAVSFFFILSGFILTYVYGRPGAPPIDRKDFYARRFARIYPGYAFGLALIGPFFIVHTIRTEGLGSFAAQALPVIALVQAYLPSVALAWNPPGWSLSVEALFYALFPLAASSLLTCRRPTAIGVAVGCYALSLLAPLAYLWIAPDGPIVATHDTYAFWLSALRYDPIVRLPEFLFGIVLGRLYLEAEMGAAWADSATGGPAALASVLASVVIVATLAESPHIPYPLLHNALLAPVFGLLIVSLARGRGRLAAWLGTSAMVALGEASYCLYIIHTPLLVLWAKSVGRLLSRRLVPSWADTLLFLAFAVFASLVCHRYVEQPLQARILPLITKKRPR